MTELLRVEVVMPVGETLPLPAAGIPVLVPLLDGEGLAVDDADDIEETVPLDVADPVRLDIWLAAGSVPDGDTELETVPVAVWVLVAAVTETLTLPGAETVRVLVRLLDKAVDTVIVDDWETVGDDVLLDVGDTISVDVWLNAIVADGEAVWFRLLLGNRLSRADEDTDPIAVLVPLLDEDGVLIEVLIAVLVGMDVSAPVGEAVSLAEADGVPVLVPLLPVDGLLLGVLRSLVLLLDKEGLPVNKAVRIAVDEPDELAKTALDNVGEPLILDLSLAVVCVLVGVRVSLPEAEAEALGLSAVVEPCVEVELTVDVLVCARDTELDAVALEDTVL